MDGLNIVEEHVTLYIVFFMFFDQYEQIEHPKIPHQKISNVIDQAKLIDYNQRYFFLRDAFRCFFS